MGRYAAQSRGYIMLKLLNVGSQVSAPYYGIDTPENYQEKSGQYGSAWYWTDRPVTYTFNSQGYRCAEFNTIDWANAIVLMGCSNTMGLGISDEDTIAWNLAALLGRPVVNLGIAGGSAMQMWANTVLLLDQQIKPHRLVYIWPSANRVADMGGSHKHYGPWSKAAELGIWADDAHAQGYSKLTWQSCQLMLGATRALHYTWCGNLARSNPALASLGHPRHPIVDHARDGLHPGPRTIQLWTRTILEDLVALDRQSN